MKKLFLSLFAVSALTFAANEAQAQTPYKSALGIVFDGYDGSNVGIQYKTALTNVSALQLQAAFRNHWVSFGADWQYEKAIPNADGLAWYAGVGAQVGIWSHDGNSSTSFGIRPQVGLEYKIPTIPIAMHLDYKPYLGLNNDTGFDGGGFTFGVKFVLK
ncbi:MULTISPECIES: hypothetical protein [Sphingobacterium]|uniref:Outer membrane protein beta-barrel domain-containing protein n=1 Tax=Sphingobacterium tenebrionis TaxID=3111775 RepID=A0ABU8I2H6_9SPHI|nr:MULTISPECIES: hypothetical protein [unclassified Sphingobacterium]QBR11775.1 hypothetical protein E3D81_06155 [Sphingobacterium sp. CZ-2]